MIVRELFLEVRLKRSAWGFLQQVAQGIKRARRLAVGLGGGGKNGVRVDEGEQIAAEAILEARHSIPANTWRGNCQVP